MTHRLYNWKKLLFMKNLFTIFITSLLLQFSIAPCLGQQTFARFSDQDRPQKEKSDIEDFKLHDNYPNPVKDQTHFKFRVKNATKVQISLFDLVGNKKRSTGKEIYRTGTHEIEMDVSGLKAGIYFYKIYVEGQTITKRLNIVKN